MIAVPRVDFTEPEPDESAVQVVDAAMLARPLPELECLIREIGLVAGGGARHLVAGYGFSGKTLAMQAAGLALAAGAPVWGAYGSGPTRRVLHVDYEQGFRLTARRYQRLAGAMGIELGALGNRLEVAIMPELRLVAGDVDRWRRVAEGRDLVIIDSLRAAAAGLDENKSEIRGCLDMLGQVGEGTGCRAVVIHHSRKPAQDAPGGQYAIRGSSAIYDSSDSVYVFTAQRREPVSVQHVKARTYGDLCEDFALVITDVELEGERRGGLRVEVRGHELVAERRQALARAGLAAQAEQDAAEVRRVLVASPGLGVRELRTAVRPMGRERLDAALYVLRDQVEVREERSGHSVARRHYVRGGGHA
jgi:RecA-family ATPase